MHAEPVLHSPYGINHKYALLTRKNCPAVFYMQAGLAVVTTQMVQTAIISNSKQLYILPCCCRGLQFICAFVPPHPFIHRVMKI